MSYTNPHICVLITLYYVWLQHTNLFPTLVVEYDVPTHMHGAHPCQMSSVASPLLSRQIIKCLCFLTLTPAASAESAHDKSIWSSNLFNISTTSCWFEKHCKKRWSSGLWRTVILSLGRLDGIDTQSVSDWLAVMISCTCEAYRFIIGMPLQGTSNACLNVIHIFLNATVCLYCREYSMPH